MKEGDTQKGNSHVRYSRRFFLGTVAAAAGFGFLYGPRLRRGWNARKLRAETFIGHVSDYGADIAGVIRSGLMELGVSPDEIRDKRILLKPNLVETHPGAIHVTTHPLVIRGAVEAFLAYGASQVLVAEGPANCPDSLLLLEESGLAEVLAEDRIPFAELNYDDIYRVENKGRRSRLATLILPATLRKADWIVSVAKMKTHHWAGVTLSMKNLFGVLPGSFYGWPKNVLHWAGIHQTVLDVCATLRPNLAIVDGIVGMEGDGPIMGTPRRSEVMVIGRNLPAVDATCARIMGINPYKIRYLSKSDGWLGPVSAASILQRGESVTAVKQNFALVQKIPAHKGIRL